MSRNQDRSTRRRKIQPPVCLSSGRWVMPTRRPSPKAPSEEPDGPQPSEPPEDWRQGQVVAEEE